MPHMVALNRPWSVGSDDSAVPAGCFLVVRLVWLFIFSSVVARLDIQKEFYVREDGSYFCEQVGLLQAYISMEIAIVLFTVGVLLVIFILSFRGSMVETEKRRRIVALWLAAGILTILDVIWALLGSVWTFGYGLKKDCYEHSKHQYIVQLLIGIVVCQWVMLLVVFLALFCIYTRVAKLYKETPTLRRRPSRRASMFRRGHTEHAKIWLRRCQLFSCNCSSDVSDGRSDAFTEISQLLARYFEEYDLVPSDIAVGLILLRRKYQDDKRNFEKGFQRSNSVASLSSIGKSALSCTYSCDNMPVLASFYETGDKNDILSLQYHSRFMAAAYGWSMFRGMNSCLSWPCKAAANVNCGCCGHGQRYEWNFADTTCQCQLSAVTELICDDNVEVVYSIWRDDVFEIPFYVAVDHTKRSIVIALRGSSSFNDALTDLCVNVVAVDVDGVEDGYVHKGMYHAALYVRATLQTDQVLDTWLDRYPGYQVLTIGHSLGAGVAALLALLLRPTYPSVFCFAYSPPGALMSLELAEYSADFVLTCFVGMDIVPRVSFATVEDLKVELVKMIAASRAPKWSVIARACPFACCGLYYCCCCCLCCPGDEVIGGERLVSPITQENITKLKMPFYQLRHQENKNQRKRMYVPGKILHIQHDEDIDGSHRYNAVWASTQDFQKIVISNKMVSDHMVHNVVEAIDQVVYTLTDEVESGETRIDMEGAESFVETNGYDRSILNGSVSRFEAGSLSNASDEGTLRRDQFLIKKEHEGTVRRDQVFIKKKYMPLSAENGTLRRDELFITKQPVLLSADEVTIGQDRLLTKKEYVPSGRDDGTCTLGREQSPVETEFVALSHETSV